GPMIGVGLEAPEIGGKRAKLALQLHGEAGIVNGSNDLATMADNARILQQPLDIGLGHGGDPGNIEAMEDLAEPLALAQDGDPGQARLETFEADLLEQPRV